ncbi:hemoglobin subunit mu-like [Neophocaena asiaeorientalis asiaeorientalis]|uniref:Hemoglobin subunit mu-like n=1 Tax=Neophocaena asiaeorientalis asiaeorientalis TaxID=1706337 RepID=A0A341BZA3_NEOAA|nr:hemoglobin subunit mu-like [Neophocaena asiaeorientalis asiaeorientalis]
MIVVFVPLQTATFRICLHKSANGSDLLLPRLLTVYPRTKAYFKALGSHPDKVQLLSHGPHILEAVGMTVRHVDNLHAGYAWPHQLPTAVQCPILLQGKFTVEILTEWDEFLMGLAVLRRSSRHRGLIYLLFQLVFLALNQCSPEIRLPTFKLLTEAAVPLPQ